RRSAKPPEGPVFHFIPLQDPVRRLVSLQHAAPQRLLLQLPVNRSQEVRQRVRRLNQALRGKPREAAPCGHLHLPLDGNEVTELRDRHVLDQLVGEGRTRLDLRRGWRRLKIPVTASTTVLVPPLANHEELLRNLRDELPLLRLPRVRKRSAATSTCGRVLE